MPASLRSRILLIMIAAVVPAAIVVCMFAYQFYDSARRSQFGTLERNADFLLSRLDALVLGTTRTAATLASFSRFAVEDEIACKRDAAAMLGRYRAFSGIAVLKDGAVLCEFRKPGAVAMAEVIAHIDLKTVRDDTPVVSTVVSPDGRLSLAVAATGIEAASPGVAVVLAIDNAGIADVLDDFRSARSSVAALADRSGRILVTPDARDGAAIWPAAPLTGQEQPHIVTRLSAEGRASVYTMAKLPSAELWLLTAQRESDVLGAPLRQFFVTALAPVVMILVAAFAIWIGLHGSVLRWVSGLLKATRAYSAGDLTRRIGDAEAAPREFAELAGAFDALADGMAERTRDLEQALAARNSYIREIHHRVKNNLQVIGSLLALQKRDLAAEDRAILRFPEDRINALSAAYRASYAMSEVGHVPIGQVVRDVSHRLQGGAEGGQAQFVYDFTGEDLEIDLDTAVSIAMLLAEILPAYADAAVHGGAIVSIALAATPKTLRLDIAGSEDTERLSGHLPHHLSRRFVQAYLRQLHATLDEATPGRTRIEAPFPAIGSGRMPGLHA